MYRKTRDEGFGAEVKRRIMLGTFVLSAGYYDAYYEKAQRVRSMLANDFAEAFKRCDVIATPTAPTSGVQDRRKIGRPAGDVSERHLHGDGQPGRSSRDQRALRPIGAGLPIGLQLIGNHFDEARLLNAAYAYEVP